MGRYNYFELLENASCPNASSEDINKLGEWFEEYGMEYWNGECYDADGKSLWPIYQKLDEEEYDIIGYTWDHDESLYSLNK